MATHPDDESLDPALAAALAGALAPVEPGPEARSRMAFGLMARVRSARAGFVTVHAHEGVWTPLLPGVDIKLLRQDEQSRSFLLRMGPGTELPPHDHPLDEECLVLEGEATLAGIVCRAGDFQLAPAGRDHGRVRSEHGCLLYIRGVRQNRATSGAR
jgi:anti-sigma factor ChrR (cupin superfamily)